MAFAREVTAWYLDRYHGTADDPGVASMFCDAERVGAFAVPIEALRAGEPAALFRVLVATTMFQRRQDLQIMRVLRGISEPDARELTSIDELTALAQGSECPNGRSTTTLATTCDLAKRTDTGAGTCGARPDIACAMKRHTVLLKRYGHFGKVPTSLAWAVREAGVNNLAELRQQALHASSGPEDAAARLEFALTRAWRVSDKIAAMFLSMLANPDLSPGIAPWQDGVDWTRWVVIDSNVDLFLGVLGYEGQGTYSARRAFLAALASRIDLSELKPGLHRFNPRLLQQAAYLFMSAVNRRALARDCSRELGACARCPPRLGASCAFGPAKHATGPKTHQHELG